MSRLEVREVPGGLAFYIDGCLQFDTRDEAVYHEALALPALALAAARFGRGPSALVLGGGDGLALRRLLDGGAKRAELVDRDPGVLALARTEFAPYNGGALYDRRVKVHRADAAAFLAACGSAFELAIADFTFPEDMAGCSLFTRDFFRSVRARLAPGGLFALNAVSPDRFPAAFWSVYRTLSSARLYPRPLRLAIPSFSAHGYGDWGMFLTSSKPLSDRELGALRFGPGFKWFGPEAFREALRLRVSGIKAGLPLSGVIRKPGDLLCLINMQDEAEPGGEMADFMDSAAARMALAGIPGTERLCWPRLSPEWGWRMREALRGMDWASFLAELEKSASGLPGKARAEIRLLREKLPDLLSGAVPDTDRAWRVFAVLLTVLVFVNIAYPDNAYAKGSYSGGGGGGEGIDVTFFIQTNKSPFHHSAYQGPQVTTVLLPSGKTMPANYIRYRAPGAPPGPAGIKDDRLYFALTDGSYVSLNGGLFYSLGRGRYLLNARPDRFVLLDKLLPEPMFEFYPEAGEVQAAVGAMEQHIQNADKALASYRKWLAWARPGVLFSDEIRAESNEARNIAQIRASLAAAAKGLQGGPAPAPRPEIPAGWLRLSPGFYLAEQRELVMADKSGTLSTYPMARSGGRRYTVLPKTAAMDEFVRRVLFDKFEKTSAGDPKKTELAALLEMDFAPPAPPPQPQTHATGTGPSAWTPGAPVNWRNVGDYLRQQGAQPSGKTSLDMRAKPYFRKEDRTK